MNACTNGENKYPNENTSNRVKETFAKSSLLGEGLYSVVSDPILETKPSPILETLTTPIMSGYESLVFEHSYKKQTEKGNVTIPQTAPPAPKQDEPVLSKPKKKESSTKKNITSQPQKQKQDRTPRAQGFADNNRSNMKEEAQKAKLEQTVRTQWKETVWDVKKNVEDTFQNKTLREQLNTKVCPHCGAKIEKNRKYCNICGKPADGKGLPPSPVEYHDSDPKRKLKDDSTESKLLALLSYLGVLVLIPLFSPYHSEFSHFHMKQGMVLMVVSIIGRVVSWVSTLRFIATGTIMLILSAMAFLSMLLIFFVWIMRIRGIIQVLQGKEVEVPVVGRYAL